MSDNKAVINIEEFIGKTVGKRTPPRDALKAGFAMQRTANALMKSCGHKLWPKGVYRFKSHEEADAWRMKMLHPNKVN